MLDWFVDFLIGWFVFLVVSTIAIFWVIVPDTVKWMNRLLEPSLTLVKLIMLPQEFVP